MVKNCVLPRGDGDRSAVGPPTLPAPRLNARRGYRPPDGRLMGARIWRDGNRWMLRREPHATAPSRGRKPPSPWRWIAASGCWPVSLTARRSKMWSRAQASAEGAEAVAACAARRVPQKEGSARRRAQAARGRDQPLGAGTLQGFAAPALASADSRGRYHQSGDAELEVHGPKQASCLTGC